MQTPQWIGVIRARVTGANRPELVASGLYVVLAVFFLYGISGFYAKHTGFTSLIRFGEQFYLRTLPAVRYAPHVTMVNSPGYDGQFYAQLATEPLLRNRALDGAIDGAPYRARRMLFAWTAYVFGLGQPAWILKAYALQNIIAWLAIAWLMVRWLPPSRPRNLVPWIGCMFGAGLLASVHSALLDGPSVLVIALAIAAQERGRFWLSAGLMGVSGLGRESNLVGAALVWRRRPVAAREWAIEAGRLALVLLPLAAWALYVRSVFAGHIEPGRSNLAGAFVGYLWKWKTTAAAIDAQGWRSSGLDDLLVLVGLTVQAFFLGLRWDWRSPWWRMAAPYILLMATTAVIVWDGTVGAAPRVLLPMTFGFNVLVARLPGRWFWPLAIAGNLSVFAGIRLMFAP